MKVDIYKPEKRYKILYADPHTRSARVREKIRKLVGGGGSYRAVRQRRNRRLGLLG